MLVDGKWSADWHPVQASDSQGGFVRQTSSFRNWVTPDGRAGATGKPGFPAEAGRYHLYVALICPWASRTLMGRKLKKLEHAISIEIVEPELSPQGWRFPEGSDQNYMHEIYTSADPRFTGRATVPVLWDKARKTIVNNESADILRMLNSGFGALADDSIDLYPAPLAQEIDAWNTLLYASFNNGVYRAGFATTQGAYAEAFRDVFAALDELEARLQVGPFLCGSAITEADVRAFVTLVRFDIAYYGLFKCNRRRIADYSALKAYVRRILDWPGMRETVSVDHIKRGYYSIESLNPNGIVPIGPEIPWLTDGMAS